MGTVANLLEFAAGETIRITVLAKNRDGTALTGAATQTMAINIAKSTSSAILYSFDSSPQISLTTELTAEFTIAIAASAIPLLLEGVTYRYDIYTTSSGADVLHQVGGVLKLLPAAEPV